ncbi:MAG: undecaprenyldiphospho-muramoylpentapeptide beta-N-acetylglucosaminyltransferase [Ignavibacteria bacterium RBG_16_34_14]|nr:MAG: undecaprenyldiphospho-muramoylpentapeptide beta-N-acetylglucosaminyltransferase [Ignavibacteria bacterium RBG_16_34_14]
MKENENKKKKFRFLFAGGGTGGHLFPAVAVAEKIRNKIPEAEILFVGSKSKIEGRVIPKLGFKFKSIWIKGFARRFSLENFLFPFKLAVSIMQSIFINMNFKPKVAIGSGGYSAGPAIFGSYLTGAKIVLLEQNSFPGVTTKMLEKYAKEIHISFEDSKKYFKDKSKLKLTGTPVREGLLNINREEAFKSFGLNASKKTLLVLGGSLGAASINEAIANSISFFEEKDIQVIWQTGKNYYLKYRHLSSEKIIVRDFIEEMNFAYSASNLIIARAGATTIAELLTLEIPAALVPSPNVAANHQYYNAKSLADQNAAILIEDHLLKDKIKEVVLILFDEKKLIDLRMNAKRISKPNAAEIIAESVIKLAQA